MINTLLNGKYIVKYIFMVDDKLKSTVKATENMHTYNIHTDLYLMS